MVQTIHLVLKVNGSDIKGDCIAAGREETIDCLSFDYSVAYTAAPVTVGSSAHASGVGGSRTHDSVVVTKRVDRTTPLLLQGLLQQQAVDVAEFQVWGPDTGPRADPRRIMHRYTVRLGNGHIVSERQFSEPQDKLGEVALMEEVSFSFQHIQFTWEQGGIETEDTV